MSLCSVCAMQLEGDGALCAHHHLSEIGWAAQNRIMCDLLHRGIVPPRLPAVKLLDDFATAEAA